MRSNRRPTEPTSRLDLQALKDSPASYASFVADYSAKVKELLGVEEQDFLK